MTIQVGKLAVHTNHRGARGDVGFRMRAEAFLRSLDLEPTGLPDRAVLIARRMELGPGGAAHRARAALAEFRRDAARPAAGPVPASAKAVLFEDEAELLTCFTADVVRGVASRWYWQQISSRLEADRGGALAAAWIRRVRWLPGSIAQLAQADAHAAVALLSPAEAGRVLQALMVAFDIDERPHPPAPSGSPTSPGHQGPAADARPPLDPPWREFLQASSLHSEAEALLGMALSLYHSPAFVRRPAYLRRLGDWRAAVGAPHWQRALATGGRQQTALAESSPADSSARGSSGSTRTLAVFGRGQGVSASPAAARIVTQARTIALAEEAPGEEPIIVPADTPHIPVLARPESAVILTSQQPARPRTDTEVPLEAWTPRWPEGGVTTGLASLLFLVNFIVWLDTDEDTVIPTGWALVDLLGRYLLRDQFAGLADDPVWGMLAELDGRRRGIPPVVELGAADPLRVPQAWLRRWSPDPSYTASREGPRLIIRHPDAGFIAADVPCTADRIDEARATAADLLGGVKIIMEGQANNPAPTAEQRFGAVVGAYVNWLFDSNEIGVSSLTSPGRVQVTDTHVDVVLNLEDVDLPARVAGLDRDPGWVPVLGRIVLFHFLASS
jgi:hypothetical protein